MSDQRLDYIRRTVPAQVSTYGLDSDDALIRIEAASWMLGYLRAVEWQTQQSQPSRLIEALTEVRSESERALPRLAPTDHEGDRPEGTDRALLRLLITEREALRARVAELESAVRELERQAPATAGSVPYAGDTRA